MKDLVEKYFEIVPEQLYGTDEKILPNHIYQVFKTNP